MRLTKKKDNCFVPVDYAGGITYRATNCFQKLGQLEDIEDELGIDLITLFKVLKNNQFYVQNGFCPAAGEHWDLNKCYQLDYLDLVPEDEGIDEFIYGKWVLLYFEPEGELDGHDMCVRLEDYGKTWALTKEELY